MNSQNIVLNVWIAYQERGTVRYNRSRELVNNFEEMTFCRPYFLQQLKLIIAKLPSV